MKTQAEYNAVLAIAITSSMISLYAISYPVRFAWIVSAVKYVLFG